jgi:DNA invertase Pin-like site-specific DNA recombinase
MLPFIAYVRVSSPNQAQSEIGFVRQEASIAKYAKLTGRQILDTVRETASGDLPLDQRPGLASAISMAAQRGAVIVVETMDRLGRDATFIDEIYKEGRVVIDVIELGCETEERRRVALARGAEVELELIRARTAEGRARARTAGRKFASGDPKKGGQARGVRITEEAREFALQVQPTIDALLAEFGPLSLGQLAAVLNVRDIPARKGGQWSTKQIARLLGRLPQAAPGEGSQSNTAVPFPAPDPLTKIEFSFWFDAEAA